MDELPRSFRKEPIRAIILKKVNDGWYERGLDIPKFEDAMENKDSADLLVRFKGMDFS